MNLTGQRLLKLCQARLCTFGFTRLLRCLVGMVPAASGGKSGFFFGILDDLKTPTPRMIPNDPKILGGKSLNDPSQDHPTHMIQLLWIFWMILRMINPRQKQNFCKRLGPVWNSLEQKTPERLARSWNFSAVATKIIFHDRKLRARGSHDFSEIYELTRHITTFFNVAILRW